MDINVKITLDASPTFMAVLQGLLKPAGMYAVPPTTPATNGATKSRKAEKAADKVPETPVTVEQTVEQTVEETVEETDDNTGSENVDVTPSVTIEQIRALIPEKKALVGANKLKELLTKYNTQNVTNLAAANYDAFYNELKNLAA